MSLEPFDDLTAEVERYELRQPTPYRFAADRREFMQVLGAGLMVAVAANTGSAQQGRRGRAPRRGEPLAERFHFGDDGLVTVFTSKVEVGQGSRTQITQAAAEELRLPPERVRLVMADTEQCPDDGGTAGSRTTPSTVPRVRNAAAAARELLTALAAERMGVEREAVTVADGVFRAGADNQLSLAELAADKGLAAALAENAPGQASVVPVERWSVLGTSVDKVDGQAVVTGAARYPSDIVRPNMLYGKVLRPPSYGAVLESIDLRPAEALEGVTVVRDGDFVGCAAATSWQARRALAELEKSARWREQEHVSSERLFEHLKQTGRESGRGGRRNDEAPANRPAGEAQRPWSASYTVAYIQHAPMEPRAAVAEWEAGKLTVYTGTQQPSRVQRELSESFRLPSERVRVIVPDTGGGFGGKHSGEAAVEAARLAKAAGKPVHLLWTREEEFTWAYFRPAGLIEVQAGLDQQGRIASWDFANYNSGGSALESPYRIANNRARYLGADSPLRQGSYRALASAANTFARESAMDELASLARRDPLEFRLAHLDEGRLKNVLMAAAERFGWQRRRRQRQANRGVGLACGTEKGSYVAACAEVEFDGDRLRLLHVCQAYECGAIQNPANLRAQVEGCLVMGLGGALYEEIEFADGRIANPDFGTYRVPRMFDVPELDIVLVDRPDLPSVGAGETPIIAIAPAIANALDHAAGVRCRGMPLRWK